MPDSSRSNPFTILCVDRERDALVLRKLILEKAGFRVLTAETAESGLDILGTQAVDLVLCDHLLNDHANTTLAAIMKCLKPDVPIGIFYGAMEFRDLRGADMFVSRAEGRSVLLEKIHHLFRK